MAEYNWLDELGFSFVRNFFRIVMWIFFSDIQVIGQENIPLNGPCVFVGNHNNQFVDPVLLMTTCPRQIGFVIAAVSLKRKIVGTCARIMKSIGVQRPQDYARNGSGTIIAENTVVRGTNTKFTKEIKIGETINVPKIEECPRVVEIISDTELKINTKFDKPVEKPTSYKIRPNLDHTQLYNTVWDALGTDHCIGIFPEGGSHDRPSLLPLKAGFCIMALGAAEKYPNTKVCVIPCGLNYFSGHRFRSRVMVEYGKPYYIKPDLLNRYKANKREGCAELLRKIESRLKNVTLNFPDYESMNFIQAVRRLYQPSNIELKAKDYLTLIRRFAEGYHKMKDLPQVQSLQQRVAEYLDKLTQYGLKDYQVEKTELDDSKARLLLMMRLVYLFLLLICSLPGFVLNAPIAIITKYLALQEAKKAKAKSEVKLEGLDVIASYKILTAMVLVPVIHGIYLLLSIILYGFWTGTFYFLLFLFASYSCIYILEEGVLVWKSSIPLAWSLLRSDYRGHMQQLKLARVNLQKEVRALVEELGPKMGEEFWSQRIVAPESLAVEGPNLSTQKKGTSLSIAQLKMHRNTYKNNDFMLDSMSLDDLEFHLFHKSEKPNEQSDEE